MVDAGRRGLLRSNHSATHLMHEALRQVLGDHVAQKGSMVAPDRLRFDFSHAKAVEADEIRAVEAIVNDRIRRNSEVITRLMTPDAAVGEGALALFGEKYGEEVRVVSMGGPGETEGRSAWSVELCGGTHAGRTGDIGLFKIAGESAVAGGVRRIEAVTSDGAIGWLDAKLAVLDQAAAALKCPPDQLAERVESLQAERRKADQAISELRRSVAEGGAGAGDSETIGDITLQKRVLDDTPAKELKSLAEAILKGSGKTVVAVVGRSEDNAVDLVRAGAEAMGGKGGGGRPDMAQAGGPDGGKAEAAMKAVAGSIKK